MSYIKKVLTYEEVTDPDEMRALGVDSLMIPPDSVVVRCVETGALEEVFSDRSSFESKYEAE